MFPETYVMWVMHTRTNNTLVMFYLLSPRPAYQQAHCNQIADMLSWKRAYVQRQVQRCSPINLEYQLQGGS